MTDISIWMDVLIAVLGGAIRVGTPFLFVSLGECLTENRPCELRARGCAGAICHGRFWWELYQWITLDWRVGRRFQWCFVGHAARFCAHCLKLVISPPVLP